MSYYYSYYIGYMQDNKIYPWGPYTANGKLKPVIERSRSFASDLHEFFSIIKNEQITDELRKEFEYEDYNGKKVCDVKYLEVSELPSSDFVKSNYYLIDDIRQYERSKEEALYFDGFYDYLTPQVYAAKLNNELKFGKNEPRTDEFGEEYVEPNASDYMYYSYPDYSSKEFESYLLKETVMMLEDYNLPKGRKYVVLETEG